MMQSARSKIFAAAWAAVAAIAGAAGATAPEHQARGRSHSSPSLPLRGEGQGGGSMNDLEIYWIDVEGGAATLIVTPAGESVLVDSGWPLPRDADRIREAARDAGLTRIDHLVTTHWHV